MTIKTGDIVRYNTEFCHSAQLDYDLANSLGLIKRIIPAKRAGDSNWPARAEILWDDGELNRSLLRTLEVYRGSIPIETKREWGMLPEEQTS